MVDRNYDEAWLNTTDPEITPVWASNLTDELTREKRGKKLPIPDIDDNGDGKTGSKDENQRDENDDDSAIGEEENWALDPFEEQVT